VRRILKAVLIFILILNLTSCSKEDVGVKTTLTGRVSDNIRGVNISNYKIVLVKTSQGCSNFKCATRSEEVASTYTDSNGDYSITFNYKINDGEAYTLSEQYYGIPYEPEYSQYISISPGITNIININAWTPIELKLNVEVLNNTNNPLMIRNEIDNSNTTFMNTENIYEENINKTYTLRSKPNTDIKIFFWYFEGGNGPTRILHQKTFLYHTTLEDVNTLSYTIDCSTF